MAMSGCTEYPYYFIHDNTTDVKECSDISCENLEPR